uniref:Putative C1q domain containing protein MgC1q96 n=1 Tax=Mytilus galloprovincialis TaxID=29158 RepID=F0V4D3_MYTGA|nr:putative C1q domain containing protein MgC1q96 [Mytilus galloprovincialis]
MLYLVHVVVVSLFMVMYVDSEECTGKITQLQSSERKLRNEMVHLQNVFLERLTRTDEENFECKNKRAFIGFSAYMSQGFVDGHSKSLSYGKTLIFDMTETNTAGVYNTNTGIFQAPSSGMYAFTWTICVDAGINDDGYGEFGVELIVDGKICGKVHADSEKHGDDACSTGFTIKYIREGGAARLRNIHTRQGLLLSSEGKTRTTFSGWKLN